MAKQSLAASAGALAQQGFNLPSVFSAPPTPIVARKVSPYITFAHDKRADEWAKIKSKVGDVREGEMYLIESDVVTHLAPAKLCWIAGRQYWAETNPAGEVLRTSFSEQPHPYKEHVEAVVLVLLADRVVPANVQFRTTKCPAAKALSDALLEAQTPEWLQKSPAHAETGVLQQPFMRFYGVVELSPLRTSRSSGLTYRTTQCAVKPTAVPEWRLLSDFAKSPDSQTQLNEAASRFEHRVNEVKAKAK